WEHSVVGWIVEGEIVVSRIRQLQRLIENVEECKTSGFFDVFPSLSKVVENCYKNGQPITTLEELEKQVLEQYKDSGKLGPECLHVALVRRQGESLYSSHLSILLDWNLSNETDIPNREGDANRNSTDFTRRRVQ
ncbi:hypothetical protein AJ79_10037, partial [Helicocarpus griseus UAMH5409]